MSSVPTAEVYLAPGFEPSSLKVAQLRGILTEHSIPIPSTSKKADLVNLFITRVKSKAAAYHDRANSVVPSTDGIREIGEDGVEMSPEPPQRPVVRSRPRQSRQSATQDEPVPVEGDVFTYNPQIGGARDFHIGATESGAAGREEAVRRRTRRVTRSSSQTPLNGTADQVEGLPRTLKSKPSFSSFVEQDEELDFQNQDREQDVGVEETVVKKKKTSRKSKKNEVELGLGAELGAREAEEEEEREREQGWEKTPSRSRLLPTLSNTSTPTPAATSGRSYESPNKFTPLASSKQQQPGSGRKEREESGFSDYNPFQSGDGEEEGLGRKTPRKTKRKTLGERKSSTLNVTDSPAAEQSEASPLKRDTTSPLKTDISSTLRTADASPLKMDSTSPSKTINASPLKRILDLASSVTATTPTKSPSSLRKIEPDLSAMRTTPEGWSKKRAEASPSKMLRFENDGEDDDSGVGAGDDLPEMADDDVDIDVKVEQETPSRKKAQTSSSLVRAASTPILDRQESRLVQRDSGALATKSETKIKFSMMMALLAFLTWAYQFQQQSIPLGYCDPASASNSIIRAKEARLVKATECMTERETQRRDHAVPDDQLSACPYESELPLIGFVPRPEKCTPCPSHALCQDGKVTGCKGEYILEPHPLLDWLNPVLSGLPGIGPVAIPPTCELDVRTKAQIGEIAKKVEERLAGRKGEIVCAGGRKNKGDKKSEVEKFGIDEEQLFQHFVRMVKVTPEQFRINLRAALKDLVVHKIVQHEVIDERDVYSAVRADMPASCRLRIAATEQIVDHKNEIGLGSFGIALLAYLRSYYQNKRKESSEVKQLIKTALSRLQDQSYTHYIDPVQAPEPFLRPNQLRDFVLDHIHNANTRQRLWVKVQPIIETNANVRVGEQEVMGDTWKIWEWIGVSKIDAQHIDTIEGSMYPQA